MREQPTRVITGAMRNRAMILAVAIITTAVLAAAIFAILHQPAYKPPPFEPEAVAGAPAPPEGFGCGLLRPGEYV